MFPQVPKSQVITPTKKAIVDYDMIKEGDRLLIGVSGGKDSLTMVHTLLALQHSSPVKFEIGACTIGNSFGYTSSNKRSTNYCV